MGLQELRAVLPCCKVFLPAPSVPIFLSERVTQHLVLGEPVVIDSGETSLGIDRDRISAISLLDPVAHLRSDCQKDTG